MDHSEVISDTAHTRARATPATEVVYTSESSLRHPLSLIRTMMADLWRARDLARTLMIRDIRAQYRRTLLGYAWAFIPPIVSAVALSAMNQSNVINVGETNIPYPAYVLFNMAVWQTFVDAINSPINAVSKSKSLMGKIHFPHEAIILANVGQVFTGFGVRFLLIVASFFWFKVHVTAMVLLAPFALLILILFGVLVGILLAPFSLLYQDVSKGLPLAISALLFVTPVIYPLPTEGKFGTFVRFNPVTPLFSAVRELATTGALVQHHGFLIIGGLTLLSIIPIWLLFKLAIPFTIERIGG